jgi:L-ribulose-5-phosphate 3-epimerase
MMVALQCGSLWLAGMGFGDWVRVADMLGFRAMELWLDRGNFWPLTSERMERRRALEGLKAHGISVPSVCPLPLEEGGWSEFRFEFNIASPDNNMRERALDFYRRAVDIAFDFEAETVLTLPGKIEEPNLIKSQHSYRIYLARLLESLKILARYAHDRGITLGVENAVICNYIDLPSELRYVVESVGEDNVRVYLDVANANVFMPPMDYVEELAPILCRQIHITDNMGDKPLHLPLGMGNIDYEKIIARLKELGWDGYLLPEIFYNDDPIGGLKICKEKLERVINKL